MQVLQPECFGVTAELAEQHPPGVVATVNFCIRTTAYNKTGMLHAGRSDKKNGSGAATKTRRGGLSAVNTGIFRSQCLKFNTKQPPKKKVCVCASQYPCSWDHSLAFTFQEKRTFQQVFRRSTSFWRFLFSTIQAL